MFCFVAAAPRGLVNIEGKNECRKIQRNKAAAAANETTASGKKTRDTKTQGWL